MISALPQCFELNHVHLILVSLIAGQYGACQSLKTSIASLGKRFQTS